MTWRWRAVPKSFKASSDRMAQAAGTISDPGKPLRARIPSRSAATRSGRKRNRPPNLVRSARGVRSSWRTSATSAVDGTGLVGSLLVAASRQFGEALFLEDRGDGRRAERLAFAGQGAADVVDGEVLLPQGDDLFAEPLLLARRSALRVRSGRRSRVRADCGTDGRGRESSRVCSRSERPPRRRGGRRRRRPGGLRIAGGWSWRAPRSGVPVLGGHWNYRP